MAISDRELSLVRGIAKLRADPKLYMSRQDPNYNAGDTTSLQVQLADFERELNDIEANKGRADTERALGFYDQYNPSNLYQDQVSSIRDLFSGLSSRGRREIEDLFRENSIRNREEAAASGISTQPGFQAAQQNDLNATRNKALQQLFTDLGVGEAQNLIGASQRAQDIGLNIAGNKAGLLTGESQFGRNLDLNKNQFSSSLGYNTQGRAEDNAYRNAALAEQVRLRKDQFKGPSMFQKVGAGFDLADKFLNTTKGFQSAFGSSNNNDSNNEDKIKQASLFAKLFASA